MRFSSILLVIDSGTNHSAALRRTVALARSESAALTVCEVVDRIPQNYLRTITAITPREVMDQVLADKYERIRKLLRSADTGNVAIKVAVFAGKPYVEISKAVHAQAHDLVIKSVANRPAARSRSITRDDRDLLRSCPCPVWLVNATSRTHNGCIIAAIDRPEAGSADALLNQHILEVSRSIALAEFRQLHIIHAWHLQGEGHLRSRGTAASILEVDRMLIREMTARMDWLHRTANAAPNDSQRVAIDYLAAELHTIKGSAITAVPELAEKLGASLIVMGTAARTGVPGVLLGNTSEKVLARSECSFLVVKKPELAVAAEVTTGRMTQQPDERQRMQG